MSRSTISTFKLLELFPTEQAAYDYIEKRLWPNGPVCPRCKGTERVSKRESGRAGLYRCNPCSREFTVKIGTIFEDSPYSAAPMALRHVSRRHRTQRNQDEASAHRERLRLLRRLSLGAASLAEASLDEWHAGHPSTGSALRREQAGHANEAAADRTDRPT